MSKRWSSSEKIDLMKLYSDGKSYEAIGKSLDRSPNAIKLRIESIIYDNLTKGKPLSVMTRLLKVDVDNIKQLYYSHKSFKEGRGEPVININFDSLENNMHSMHPSPSTIFSRGVDSNSIIKKQENVQKGGGQYLENIEKENEIMEAIIKNHRMKRYVRKLYVDGMLDKKSIEIYNRLMKKNI
jgi:hypothetical protein